MTGLLRAFAGIALLRLDPSVLPASIVLLVLTAAAYAAASAAASRIVIADSHWLGRALLDVGSTLAIFWLMLALRRRGHRWRQTMSAIFGSIVLLAPLAIALQWVFGIEGAPELVKVLATSALMAVVIWTILIVGHVLRSAIEVGQVAGIALALAWFVANSLLVERVYPAPAG